MSEKVSIEVCEAEFERFAEAMDLDIEMKGMDDDDRRSFESAKRRVIRAMQANRLVINENGEPVFTPAMGDAGSITFHEPTGASRMAMDAKKEGHHVKKGTAVLADMTRTSEATFAKMANRDFKVCEALVALFFG